MADLKFTNAIGPVSTPGDILRAAAICEQQAERWTDDRARYIAHECAAAIRAAAAQPFKSEETGNWLVRDETRPAFKNVRVNSPAAPVCDRCLGFGTVNFRPCEQCAAGVALPDGGQTV